MHGNSKPRKESKYEAPSTGSTQSISLVATYTHLRPDPGHFSAPQRLSFDPATPHDAILEISFARWWVAQVICLDVWRQDGIDHFSDDRETEKEVGTGQVVGG